MTENKRFTRRNYAIYEKGNPICMTLRDVDNRLNELWEENEQLKKDCKSYTWYKLYKKLLNENEQLKQLIKETLEITPMKHSLAIKLKNSIKEMYE